MHLNDSSKLADLPSLGRAPMLVFVRPSNEHILIVRVPGAQDQRGCPSLPYFTRNGFEFSPEAVVTDRRTRPFFPPLGTVVTMLSLVC